MTVLVDAYNLSLEKGTGVATYGRNLISAASAQNFDVGVLYGSPFSHSKHGLLNEIGLVDSGDLVKGRRRLNIYDMLSMPINGFVRHANRIEFSGRVILPPERQFAASHYWNIKNLYQASIGLYRSTGIATTVKVDGVNMAHWTYPLPISASGACNIYTLHDLVPLRLPYTTADKKRVYFKLCKRIAAEADHIVTVSECSRRDIIDLLDVPEEKVTNTWQSSDIVDIIDGVDDALIEIYVRGVLGVSIKEYFLFFGAIEPKKNIARMLEAYLSSGSKSPLVIVGAPGWGGEKDTKLLKSLASLDSNGRVIWLGYLPREMLAMLIAGAKATLFPSLYEGFGLPVLESMSLGTPVISSNTSSIPEISGDAAYLVNPYDTRSLAKAIVALDNDSDMRSAMRNEGLVQAQKFSKEAYSQSIKELYSKFT